MAMLLAVAPLLVFARVDAANVAGGGLRRSQCTVSAEHACTCGSSLVPMYAGADCDCARAPPTFLTVGKAAGVRARRSCIVQVRHQRVRRSQCTVTVGRQRVSCLVWFDSEVDCLTVHCCVATQCTTVVLAVLRNLYTVGSTIYYRRATLAISSVPECCGGTDGLFAIRRKNIGWPMRTVIDTVLDLYSPKVPRSGCKY